MAKQSALQLVNKVLGNLGESAVSDLLSLSGLSLLVFNSYNEVLYDLAFEGTWKPLESDISITLVTGTSTYSKVDSSGGTLYAYDKDSFRYNEARDITFYSPQKMDREYKTQTDSGVPRIIYDWKSYFNVYPLVNASASGKVIKGRGWTLPTVLATATPSGTCWIPEGFDLTMLADYVTYKILHYKQNAEALTYYTKVWGDGRDNEGSLTRFKRLYWSPEILDGNIVVEPMERSFVRGIVQPPITA